MGEVDLHRTSTTLDCDGGSSYGDLCGRHKGPVAAEVESELHLSTTQMVDYIVFDGVVHALDFDEINNDDVDLIEVDRM